MRNAEEVEALEELAVAVHSGAQVSHAEERSQDLARVVVTVVVVVTAVVATVEVVAMVVIMVVMVTAVVTAIEEVTVITAVTMAGRIGVWDWGLVSGILILMVIRILMVIHITIMVMVIITRLQVVTMMTGLFSKMSSRLFLQHHRLQIRMMKMQAGIIIETILVRGLNLQRPSLRHKQISMDVFGFRRIGNIRNNTDGCILKDTGAPLLNN
jgi:hypothetical protein